MLLLQNQKFWLIVALMTTICNSSALNRSRKSAISMKQIVSEKISSVEKPSNKDKNKNPRMSFSKTSEMTPIASNLFRCPLNKTEKECTSKTSEFKNKVLRELIKSMKMNGDGSDHKIDFSNNLRELSMSSLLSMKIKTIRRKNSPFNGHKIGELLPKEKIFHKKRVKSCVIVSSAGSMAGASLGQFIDDHDIVMRFNHAPTIGYEMDVGSKTSIRIVNSQVVSKPEFNFLTSPLFKNITLAAWDPAPLNSSLEDWFTSPDFDLFTNYEKFMTKNQNADFHLINPRSLWELWGVLQTFAAVPIVENIPSSGFIGIALLLPICSKLNIVEYVPSTRLNGRCHYYSDEINLRCTFGAWHPLATEKLLAYSMNTASDFTVFQKGILTIIRPKKN